jgi:hypothetical protein
MAWSILGGFFMALYTLYCLRELGLSEATFGVIISVGGVGSLGGAVLARSLARVLGVGWTLFATSAASLGCSLFIPLAASATSHAMMISFLVAHQLLSDGFSVAFIVLAVTLRQTVMPRDLLGRANAAVHVCTAGVLPVAALIAGGLSTWIGTRTAVWIGVLIGLVAPIFVWPLRHLKDMPVADPAASQPAARPAGTTARGCSDVGDRRYRRNPRPTPSPPRERWLRCDQGMGAGSRSLRAVALAVAVLPAGLPVAPAHPGQPGCQGESKI